MQEVLFEKTDGVGIITINRPEAKNSINNAVAVALSAAVDEIEENPELQVGILTGAGATFCAGMDLKAFVRGEKVKVGKRGFAGFSQGVFTKPMIAAVEGHAVAGGFELALACDLIVASRTAKFGLPEVKRGLVANAGGMVRLPRQLPYRIALELALTGDMIDAETIAAYGLLNRLVEPGTALDGAKALARSIAGNGPLAIAVSKRVIHESQDWNSDEMFALQEAITAPVMTSADAREGALAFAEKRKPVWRGI